jgi:hypothetical protein
MIFFIGREAMMQRYLSGWGAPVSQMICFLSYEALLRQKTFALGTYVFMDIDYLSGVAAERAESIWKYLHESGHGIRLLNHPTRSLKRYELLRTLKERGMNSFDAYRLTEARWPRSFPVFIREANAHSDSRCVFPLLHTQDALESALNELLDEAWNRDDKVIVEYCDTSDGNGLYRKYSAFCVGNRIVPVHEVFSTNWMTKTSHTFTEELSAEEFRYVQTNPHQDQVQKIFALAGIQYGRIDYSLLNGKLQTWEINTNPHVIPRVTDGSPRFRALKHSSTQLNDALLAIDSSLNPLVRIPNPVRKRVVRRERRETLHRWLRLLGLLRYEPKVFAIVSWYLTATRRLSSLKGSVWQKH